MTLTFRRATTRDCELAAAVVNEAYRGESGRAGWTTESHLLDGLRTDTEALVELVAGPNNTLLLAFCGDDRLVGCVHLERRGADTCYLGMFTVRPSEQTRGLGKALLAAAESFARDVNGARVMEMTVITVRAELLAWYERRGYVRTGRMVPFPVHPRFGVLKVPSIEMETLTKALV